MANRTGEIFVIAAPSGTGKTTIIKEILKKYKDIVFSVSSTTRKARNGEVHGKDYFFISEEEFLAKKDSGFFIEWELVYDYFYGTEKTFVENTISSGSSILIEVDVKGALAIKKFYPEAVLIFIVPPSVEELINRLKNRRTETEEDFQKRIDRAKMELSLKDKFDYLVTNENLEIAISELSGLITEINNKGTKKWE